MSYVQAPLPSYSNNSAEQRMFMSHTPSQNVPAERKKLSPHNAFFRQQSKISNNDHSEDIETSVLGATPSKP